MRLPSSELDPKGNYLFGYHPHGIMRMRRRLVDVCQRGDVILQSLPGLDLRLLTLSVNFKFPFTREVLMALGVNSVTKMSVLRNLTPRAGGECGHRHRRRGRSLGCASGRSHAHALPTQRVHYMALRTGASLVPVFAFGENDIFEQVENPEGHGLSFHCTLNNSSASHLRLLRSLSE